MARLHKKRLIGAALLGGTLVAVPVCAKDYANHWAEQTIDTWSTSGIIQGQGEGVFNPDGNVTRAEFAAFIDRLFQYKTPETPRNYSDIEAGSWYEASAIDVASQGVMYLPGDAFAPQQHVTRQEVAHAMAKVYKLQPTLGNEVSFTDQDAVAPWAANGIQALAQGGYLGGYPDGSFHPEGLITRAEMMTLIDNMTTQYHYTSGTYTEDVVGNVIINTTDVTLQDLTIDGNLYITAGAETRPIKLDQVTVTGDVMIEGGDVTLAGTYNTVTVKTDGQVDFLEGTASQISVEAQGAPVTLHKGTKTQYLQLAAEREVHAQGTVVQSSESSFESLRVESAGVYMGHTFAPVEVEDNTITINLQQLANNNMSDSMESLIIYTNKEDAYLAGYYGSGKMMANTRYAFRRADQELGMIEDLIDQVKDDHAEIASIADSLGVTSDTVFSMLTEDGRISLRYLISQYDTVRQMVQQFTGITVDDSYTFTRKLYHADEEPVTVTINLEIR